MIANSSYYQEKETSRLNLRLLTPADAIEWEKWILDPIATKHFPEETKGSPEKSKIWIDRQLTRYENKTFGFFALELKETGAFIGQCGLLLQNIEGKEELEVGYSLIRKYWGNGYAHEASKLFIEYAFNNHNLDRLISMIEISNHNSQRVAIKNGLKPTKTIPHYGLQCDIYEILREEYNN